MSGLFIEVRNMLVKFEARIVLTFLWSYEQNEAFNVQFFFGSRDPGHVPFTFVPTNMRVMVIET